MTPERINTVIAEWCGWKHFGFFNGSTPAAYPPNGTAPGPVPNFFGDRNAFHAAYANLTDVQKYEYICYLLAINYCSEVNWSLAVDLLDAELPECCEALLRTIGRWEESK